MPEVLPLYRERPSSPLEAARPLAIDPGCHRCRHSGARIKTPCMAPEWTGEPGGLLVVSDYPGGTEDARGRPFVGQTGKYLRPLLRRLWSGPIALDNAVKCRPRSSEKDAVDWCRGYLARTLRDSRPSKVLAMGRQAIFSVTGREVAPLAVRRGYGWVRVDGQPVPVYLFPNPVVAVRNRFLRRWLEEDLEWALTRDPPFSPAWDGVVRVVSCEEDALRAEAEARAAGWFSFDIETAGRMWGPFQVVSLALWHPGGGDDAWAWSDAAWGDPRCVEPLARLLRDPDIGKVGSNVHFDENGCLLGLEARVGGVTDDVRLARKTLDADASGYLRDMAELVGMGGHKEEAQRALAAAAKTVRIMARDNVKGQMRMFDSSCGLRRDVQASIRPEDEAEAFAYGVIPRDVCVRYNAMDAVSTGRLKLLLEDRRAEDDPALARTYRRTVMPAALAGRQVEEWGVLADREAIEHFAGYLRMKRQEAWDALRPHVWAGYKVDSNNDERRLLYKELGLPCAKATDTGQDSVDKEALEQIRHLHPAVALILAHRHLVYQDSHFATGLLRFVRDDGRIHPSLMLDGARSGRMSCRDPNLQTIPNDDHGRNVEGKLARDCFVAPPGWVMVSIDYSQIELRVAAMLSGDQVMTQLFRDGRDFHQATAELIGKPRPYAKAINFGLLYGKGDEALARDLGCSKRQAAEVHEAILGKFTGLARWIRERLAEAKKTGYCWTWWGGQRARRRSLHRIADKDSRDRSTAENGAINTPVQGSASEYLVRSLTEIVEWFVGDGVPAKVVLPVHDSVLMEVREDVEEEVVSGASDIMTSWGSGDVPLVVDVERGRAWGSLEKSDDVTRAAVAL